jgi:hypothetical protein
MNYFRGFVGGGLVVAAFFLILADLVCAERIMILRYNDGSSQTVRLERPSETIRQIEFSDGKKGPGHDRGWRSGIRVISGSYGQNCGARYENATDHLATVCDGKNVCEYVIDSNVIGDPAPGCLKNYIAEWQCGEDGPRVSVTVSPEAGSGKRALLRCPPR